MIVEAEVIAIQFAILALIKAHPDKQRLLKEYELLTTSVQLQTIASGDGIVTPEPIRRALDRFRSQIAEGIE
ncbi:hypothetical protein [Desulforhopalus singaporensis]|uniref:Uncharacterized protein n=1 Tax=Desulforhopalus singaporensis TaxID=91360 RepID=A0A1H0TIM8_9BACT|nr:hypothetical protein [Desulforhopalus singaporensis]SDP53893.1 hypothetical protein SAMN05660330_03125 [Desulforhopalus singaporensis]